jgi:uncharacterized membrane protein
MAVHNLFDFSQPAPGHMPGWLWQMLHAGGFIPVVIRDMEFQLIIAYPALPWFGVMAFGYGIGSLYSVKPAERRQTLLRIGLILCVAFVLLRYVNLYGDRKPWSIQADQMHTVMSFLDCHKYPPSLAFCLMTLGPALVLLGLLDRPAGLLGRFFRVFGRVPFLFYLLHAPILYYSNRWLSGLHAAHKSSGLLTPSDQHWMQFQELGLARVFIVWLIVIAILFPVCAWFAGVKQRTKATWLTYL